MSESPESAPNVEPENPVRLGDRPTGWLHPVLTRVFEKSARANIVQRLTAWLVEAPRRAELENALVFSPMQFEPDWNDHAESLGPPDAAVAMVALVAERALEDDPKRVVAKVGEFEAAQAASATRRTRRSDERRAREFLEALSTPELVTLVYHAQGVENIRALDW